MPEFSPLTIVVLVILAVVGLIMFISRQPSEDTSSQSVTVASLISDANSLEELLDIADENYFDAAESDAFLAKLLPFETNLDTDDWEIVYLAAEQGSRLQVLAHKHYRE